MRRALWAIAMVVLLSGCSTDPYPIPPSPPPVKVHNPVLVGTPVTTVLIFLAARPGDRIELLGAEAIGSFDGATVRILASRAVAEATGEMLIGEALEPLEGVVVTTPSASPAYDRYMDTVGIVGELTAQRPGRFEVTSVRLHYRLNGGDERVG
jgi:hypothetical protein